MSFTFSDQLNLLSILLADPNSGADDAWTLAIRKKYINRGELQFAKDSKLLHEYATAAIASNQIEVPSDWLETFALVIGNYVITKDREISIQDYDRWYSYTGSYPLMYMSEVSGTRYIKLIGTVNGESYYLYYVKKPTTELSNLTDTSLFPEEFREASVYWAAFQLLQQIGKTQMADRYASIYNKLVRDARARAEEMYMRKTYANPDVNAIDAGQTDIVGGGYDYGTN